MEDQAPPVRVHVTYPGKLKDSPYDLSVETNDAARQYTEEQIRAESRACVDWALDEAKKRMDERIAADSQALVDKIAEATKNGG